MTELAPNSAACPPGDDAGSAPQSDPASTSQAGAPPEDERARAAALDGLRELCSSAAPGGSSGGECSAAPGVHPSSTPTPVADKPPAPAAPRGMMQQDIVMPLDRRAGDKYRFVCSDGRTVEIALPGGYDAGEIITVRFPGPKPKAKAQQPPPKPPSKPGISAAAAAAERQREEARANGLFFPPKQPVPAATPQKAKPRAPPVKAPAPVQLKGRLPTAASTAAGKAPKTPIGLLKGRPSTSPPVAAKALAAAPAPAPVPTPATASRAAPAPVPTETIVLPQKGWCRTPGCIFRDFHEGLCSNAEVPTSRKRVIKKIEDAELGGMKAAGLKAHRANSPASAPDASDGTVSDASASQRKPLPKPKAQPQAVPFLPPPQPALERPPKVCKPCPKPDAKPPTKTPSWAREETLIIPEKGMCGTPGCTLPNHHPGLCTSVEVGSTRNRKAKKIEDAELGAGGGKAAVEHHRKPPPAKPAAPRAPASARAGPSGPAPEWFQPAMEQAAPALGPDPMELIAWVQCERCSKWRRLPPGVPAPKASTEWVCAFHPDPNWNDCNYAEEADDGSEEQATELLSEVEAKAARGELPPGWSLKTNFAASRAYKTYVGPGLQKAQSVRGAWRTHIAGSRYDPAIMRTSGRARPSGTRKPRRSGVRRDRRAAAEDFAMKNWVQCEQCAKWRSLAPGLPMPDSSVEWVCAMNPDTSFNSCNYPEEVEDDGEEGDYGYADEGGYYEAEGRYYEGEGGYEEGEDERGYYEGEGGGEHDEYEGEGEGRPGEDERGEVGGNAPEEAAEAEAGVAVLLLAHALGSEGPGSAKRQKVDAGAESPPSSGASLDTQPAAPPAAHAAPAEDDGLAALCEAGATRASASSASVAQQE